MSPRSHHAAPRRAKRRLLAAWILAATLPHLGCHTHPPRQSTPHAATTAASPASDVPTPAFPRRRLDLPGIHNAWQVSPRLYSGSQPEGDAAFAALARLGIRTIISVDGSRPDTTAARRHGLRYVHLPVGYDGIPEARVAELTAAARTLPGPTFVHCHHGLHRGPAAVAILGEATEAWSPEFAQAWMHQAGTSPDYPGLYRAAATFRPPPPAAVAAITSDRLPEIARTPSLVDAMVRADSALGHLKASRKAGGSTPDRHADITPRHQATLLREELRELARLPDTARRPDAYRARLEASERAARELESLLAAPAPAADLDAALSRLARTCADCHREHRDGPGSGASNAR